MRLFPRLDEIQNLVGEAAIRGVDRIHFRHVTVLRQHQRMRASARLLAGGLHVDLGVAEHLPAGINDRLGGRIGLEGRGYDGNGEVRISGPFRLAGEADNLDAAFLERFHKRFGADYPNVTELAMGTYQGFYLWAEAVKKVNSTDRMKVIEGLETGISIDAPSGKVTIDPATHHCILDVHIAEVKDKKLNVLEDFAQQPPSDTAVVCNLTKNPNDNQQYVIKAD